MASDTFSARFVGRSAELERLHGFHAGALDGRGTLCFVTGEPGAGKSSLLAAFVREVQQRHPGVRVAVGDCNPQTGVSDAYLPFREIMTELTGEDRAQQPGTDAARTSEKFMSLARRALAEHGPDLVDIFVPGGAILTRVGAQAAGKIRAQRAGSPEAGSPGKLEQRHLLEQYTNVVRTLAAERPLVLLVDDLHWADEASISLLFHLARRVGEHRVLLVGAYRAQEIEQEKGGASHPLKPMLNEARRYFGDVRIDLQQSQDQGGRAFIDELLDAEPNRLDERFRQTLHAHTGGHALFTVELLDYLAASGDLRRDAEGRWIATPELSWSALPARVEGVIDQRTATLDPTERELLVAASILGESFSAEALAACLGLEARDVVRQLSGPLARRLGLVRSTGFERIGTLRLAGYEFRHNLFHHYFYDSLDEVERGYLHEQAGEALEALFAEAVDHVAVQLARHFDRAELPARAAPYFLAAADTARLGFAHKAALSHYGSALRCLDSAGTETLSGIAASEARLRVLTGRAEVELLVGDFAQARERFQQGLELLGEHAELRRARLLRRIAVTHEREHRHDLALETLDKAEEALQATTENGGASDGDREAVRSEQIELDLARLWLNYWTGNLSSMQALIDGAGVRIEADGTPAQRLRYLSVYTAMLNRRDRFRPSEEAQLASRRARDASLAEVSELERADGLFGYGFTQLLAGRLEEALDAIGRSVIVARQCGDRTLEARCLTYIVTAKRQSGDVAAVLDLLAEAESACREVNMGEYVAVLDACRGWAHWRQGEGASATECIERAMRGWRERAPRYPMKWLALMVRLQLEHDRDDVDGALETIGDLLQEHHARLADDVAEALERARERLQAESSGGLERLSKALALAAEAGYL